MIKLVYWNVENGFAELVYKFTGSFQYTKWQQADWMASRVDSNVAWNSRCTVYWIAGRRPAFKISHRQESTRGAQESSQVNNTRKTINLQNPHQIS